MLHRLDKTCGRERGVLRIRRFYFFFVGITLAGLLLATFCTMGEHLVAHGFDLGWLVGVVILLFTLVLFFLTARAAYYQAKVLNNKVARLGKTDSPTETR